MWWLGKQGKEEGLKQSLAGTEESGHIVMAPTGSICSPRYSWPTALLG